MKYYKWIGIAASILLIVSCFLPWTYHADIQSFFTGFYSKNNAYGKPGKVLIFFAVLSVILILTKKVWAKRMHLFVAGVLVAFTIRNYIVFTTCYFGYCPERKYGLILVLISSAVLLLVSIFPDMKVTGEKQKPIVDEENPS